MLVAEHDRPELFARIGIIRGHVERVFDSLPKDADWGRRKLARAPLDFPPVAPVPAVCWLLDLVDGMLVGFNIQD